MSEISARHHPLLEKLFAGSAASFHHRLGLYRLAAADFYGAGSDSEAILADKRAALESAGGDLYQLESDQGQAAFQEFARWSGAGVLASDEAGWDPRAANRAISLKLEPDYLLMIERGGAWRLAWASVCFPTRWSLVGKSGRTLGEIHGAVPDLNGQIGRKIDTFFERLVPAEGWGRANWGLATNAERNQHPTRAYQPLTEATPLENIWVRLESQHLCKLPKTGAVAFGIRILSFPLTEVQEQPAVAAGLREQLRTMPGEVAAYKGIPATFWQRL